MILRKYTHTKLFNKNIKKYSQKKNKSYFSLVNLNFLIGTLYGSAWQ